MMRQLIGARIELGIGEAFVIEHQGHCIWCLCGLPGEQLRQGGGRDLTPGIIPVA